MNNNSYMDISCIVCIKNRDKIPTEKFFYSLKNQIIGCQIVIVDYGGDKINRKWQSELFKGRNITYIEVDNNVEIFNKCRALNIGIKQSFTPYIVSVDIDCIYSPNFTLNVLNTLKNKNCVVLSQKIDLDKNNNEINLHELSASGSCIGLKKEWLEKVHGYDEFYTYWGREDNDLVDRAKQDSLDEFWITDKVKIWHQWHNPSSQQTIDSNSEYYDKPNKPLIRNSDGWGKL